MTNLEARIQQELAMIGHWQNQIKHIEENHPDLKILIPQYARNVQRHEDVLEWLEKEKAFKDALAHDDFIHWLDQGRAHE